MMISPEGYYEVYLKGKTEKEIRTAIRSLKNNIGRLKNTMEQWEYQSIICPSEDVQLKCNRLYLEEAKKALAEVGGEYKPSKAELKAQEFDDNILNIAKIEFSIGVYFGGYPVYQVDLSGDELKVLFMPPLTSAEESNRIYLDNDKASFLEQFRELHIGEWKKKYVNYNVLDGTQWHLIIYYDNGKRPIRYYGSNAFPYNFEGICNLFDIEKEK